MVSDKGIVAFVDCDSFQVAEGSRIFRCGVGVPEYTPPELHGKNFSTLDRAANHDLFGLAVLVFHLLMMGRHPFSGVPLVKADIPIEKAIQDGLYAYTRSTAGAKLKPPPHVPPVMMLGTPLLDLFERAFGSGRRPTATDWRAALDAAMKQLIRCKNDPRHAYLTGQCPWCELISGARLMFFLPSQQSAAAFRIEDFDQLLQKIASLSLVMPPYTRPRPPGHASVPPVLKVPTPKPSLTHHPPIPRIAPAPTPNLRHPQPAVDPPRPKLKPLPDVPVYPPVPELGPPDPFLSRLCMAAMAAGFLIIFIAKPVGFITMTVFAVWFGIMKLTEAPRREKLLKALRAQRRAECDRMDEEHAVLLQPIEASNQRRVAAWQNAKAALDDEYNRLCRHADEEDRRQHFAWDSARSARMAEHDRACREVDAANRRLIEAWEALNAPWIEQKKKWLKDLAQAEAELIKLEADLSALCMKSAERFERQKMEAEGCMASHGKVKQEYEKDLKQAEDNSRQFQLEEYLDGFLIRNAKLTGVTNARVLSLESFGIQTAKDVALLENQKVPGIGPVLGGRLTLWRDTLAVGFRPKQGIAEVERTRIASRFAPVLLPVGQTLAAALKELEGLIGTHRHREREILQFIGASAQRAATAEATVQALHAPRWREAFGWKAGKSVAKGDRQKSIPGFANARAVTPACALREGLLGPDKWGAYGSQGDFGARRSRAG